MKVVRCRQTSADTYKAGFAVNISAKTPLLVVSAFLLAACAEEAAPEPESEQSCEGGKCDEADEEVESPCDGTLVDEAGLGLGDGAIAGRLGDPIAKLVYGTDGGCPADFEGVVEKLLDSGKCTSHQSVLASETAQLAGQPTDYRSVTIMDCDVGEATPGRVFFSLFGVRAASNPSNTSLPSNAEMIAFDPARGIFNYYETEGDKVAFFGDSAQFVLEGRGPGSERRCAGCHTGGGLVMKELARPWLHWPDDIETPGHAEIIEGNAAVLGAESGGEALEDMVREGNTAWNATRIETIRAGVGVETTVADLLRPLFCTVEVNLESNAPETNIRNGRLSEVVLDERFKAFKNIKMNDEVYDALIRANGQRMAVGGTIDTLLPMTRITRGAADVDYEAQLIAAELVDAEFVEDVLFVDFTRPVFSDDRCELLEFAPELEVDDLSADAIRDGFIKNLEDESPADGTPAGDLLRNLSADDDDLQSTVRTFTNTCSARSETEEVRFRDADGDNQTLEVSSAAKDYMTFVAHIRGLANELQVFEFRGLTMPIDEVDEPRGLRFDPSSCELTTEYVSIEPEVE